MQSPLHFLNRPEIDFLPYTQSTSGIVIHVGLSNMRRATAPMVSVMANTIDWLIKNLKCALYWQVPQRVQIRSTLAALCQMDYCSTLSATECIPCRWERSKNGDAENAGLGGVAISVMDYAVFFSTASRYSVIVVRAVWVGPKIANFDAFARLGCFLFVTDEVTRVSPDSSRLIYTTQSSVSTTVKMSAKVGLLWRGCPGTSTSWDAIDYLPELIRRWDTRKWRYVSSYMIRLLIKLFSTEL